MQRVFRKRSGFQTALPVVNYLKHVFQIELLVRRWIFFQIRLGQLEKRGRRTQPIFLQMHECTRQLNQSLVKRVIRPVPLGQPELFENIVRFVEKSAIEIVEVTGVMRIDLAAVQMADHLRNFCALDAHEFNLRECAEVKR